MRFDQKSLLIILVLLLTFGFLMRLSILQRVHVSTKNYSENGSIEYLIASHTVKYKEVPQVGPLGSILNIKHPPTYYYLLASFLEVKNDYIFIKIINVLFQVSTILILFFLAKKMFGVSTALIASTLFTFSQTIIIQSGILFQYHFMQTFLILSFLILAASYIKKNYALLVASIFTYLFAGSLAYAALSLLPLFALLIYLIIKRNHNKLTYYTSAIILSFIFVLLLYSPALIYNLEHKNNIFLSTAPNLLESFSKNLHVFFKLFFLGIDQKMAHLLFLALSAGVIFYLYIVKKTERKVYTAILISAIMLVLLLNSLFGFSYERLFIPVLGLFILLLSELINSILAGRSVLPLKIILIIILLNVFHPNLAANLASSLKRVTDLKFDTHPAITPVLKEIKTIQKDQSFNDFHFFKFHTIYGGTDYANLHAFFWINLEKELNTKFTALSSTNLRNFEVLNDDRYIFLVCYWVDPPKEKVECLDKFSKEHPNHKLIKNVYSQYPVSIYLAALLDTFQGSTKIRDNCKNIASTNQQIECWEDLVKETLNKNGLKDAFELIADLYSTQPLFAKNCHNYAHIIGQTAYEQFKIKQDINLPPQTTFCGYGFYHGFIEELLAKEGNLDEARQFCRMVDEKLAGKIKNSGLACFHGIGHGNVDIHDKGKWGNEQALIDSALKLCDLVAENENEIYRCSSGVFNAISILEIKNEYGLASNRQDPIGVCRKQAEKYRLGCYNNMIIVPMITTEHDFLKASRFVEEISDDKYALAAIKAMSAWNARKRIQNEDYSSIISDCRRLKEHLRLDCIAGFSNGLIEFGEPTKEHIKAISFCTSNLLSDIERDRCLNNINHYFADIYEPEKARTLCKQMFGESSNRCR